MPNYDHTSSRTTPLRYYRQLMGISGAAYLVWWVSVQLLLPGSYNPLGSRLAVVMFCWALLAATYLSAFASRKAEAGLLLCLCAITGHYFYLFHRNQADINWVVGSYITVIAACSCLQTESGFVSYSVCVLALSGALSLLDPILLRTIFLPGVLTILAFAYIGLRARLKLVQSLSLQNAQLQALNEELEAFSSSVSHDLRAPLRATVGFSKVILSEHGSALSEEVKRLLGKIIKGGEKMADLIESLLYMSKLSRQEVRRAEIDLSGLCAKIADGLRRESPGRQGSFKIEAGLKAFGDQTLLEAALNNLIGNAWKYTQLKPEAAIEVGAKIIDGKVTYFVADNGAGFDMSHAKSLFGVFQRLHSEAEFAGTGVGLATVKRIVQSHGGRIWAEAKPGLGATFYFTL